MSDTQFFIYVRKSTDDLSRQIRSIDDQIAELKELAARESLTVVDVLAEKQTAKIPGRPVFNRMIERIEHGEASGILAWHPDRLARNSVDGGRIIYLVDTKKIVDLRFPTFVFDPTPSGKFMLSIMFGQSKYYVDSLSENIKRGHRQKVKNGLWPHLAPVGYINDRNTRTIIPDPIRGPLVRRLFEVYAAGDCTLDRATTIMRDAGLTAVHQKKRVGVSLSRAQIHRLLRNPIYYGPFMHGGELHLSSHTPLITKELFDRVQQIMQGKRMSHTKVLKPYLYRRFFTCDECGGVITIETQKGFNYLRCTKKKGPCSQPFVREEKISEQVADALSPIAMLAGGPEQMLTELTADIDSDSQELERLRSGLRLKLTEADQKLKRLTDAYIANVLTLDEFQQAKNGIVIEKTTLKQQSQSLQATQAFWLEPTLRFVNSLSEAILTTLCDNPLEKAKLLKNNGSNLKMQEGRIRFEFRGPWKIVEKHGRLAQQNTAPRIRGAVLAGKSSKVSHVAERGRFELPLRLLADRFSKPVLNSIHLMI